ncbi:MAG: DUF4286 family protein [Dehalococcoidia bacterium]|nr:DUF4286 family protein [Dehalococcoidia bacterium]
MPTGPIINIVATECPSEIESKFNKWYNEVHVPMLLKFKGLKGVTRYKLAKESAGHPAYLAVYEFESQEAFEAYKSSPVVGAVREEMGQTWPDKKFEMKYQVQYEPIKTWKK